MKTIIIAAVAALLAAAGTAGAATHVVSIGEHEATPASFGFPTGYLKINPATCRFYTPERDVRPGANEPYARAEDLRDDVLFGCLRNKADRQKTVAPDTCWTAPPPVTEAKPDRQGFKDERGLVALQSWAATLAACEAARNA